MNVFVSYYWDPDEIHDANLRTAVELLTDPSATIDQIRSAFITLMQSEDTRARCLAFEHFFQAGTTESRFPNSPYEIYETELLTLAREELSRPPIKGELPTGTIVDAANHASALQVIWRLSDESDTSDIMLIEKILENPAGPVCQRVACQAAYCILSGSNREYPQLLTRLHEMALDESAEEGIRLEAVNAMGDWHIPATEEALVVVAATCTVPVAARAACALLWRDPTKHEQLVRTLLESWANDERDFWVTRARNLLADVSK